mmetsp:Transcript_27366/g.38689  ORF Transcript_27366/g.38689 Transcript_27366/m.38689 type:complete len:123 (-) Transcript_27366:880-1248(-)
MWDEVRWKGQLRWFSLVRMVIIQRHSRTQIQMQLEGKERRRRSGLGRKDIHQSHPCDDIKDPCSDTETVFIHIHGFRIVGADIAMAKMIPFAAFTVNEKTVPCRDDVVVGSGSVRAGGFIFG